MTTPIAETPFRPLATISLVLVLLAAVQANFREEAVALVVQFQQQLATFCTA